MPCWRHQCLFSTFHSYCGRVGTTSSSMFPYFVWELQAIFTWHLLSWQSLFDVQKSICDGQKVQCCQFDFNAKYIKLVKKLPIFSFFRHSKNMTFWWRIQWHWLSKSARFGTVLDPLKIAWMWIFSIPLDKWKLGSCNSMMIKRTTSPKKGNKNAQIFCSNPTGTCLLRWHG